MFVADVKCPQATWQTVPNSRTDSTKASVFKAVVRTWHRAHVIRGRQKGSSVATVIGVHNGVQSLWPRLTN